MLATFHMVGDMTTWTRKAKGFCQCPGETIRSLSDRFDLEIVETYPTYGFKDLLWMQIFSQGIHPYLRCLLHRKCQTLEQQTLLHQRHPKQSNKLGSRSTNDLDARSCLDLTGLLILPLLKNGLNATNTSLVTWALPMVRKLSVPSIS